MKGSLEWFWEKRKERCLYHKHLFHESSLQLWKRIITPYGEKRRYKIHNLKLSVRRNEWEKRKIALSTNFKNISTNFLRKVNMTSQCMRVKKNMFGYFSVWAYVFLKDRISDFFFSFFHGKWDSNNINNELLTKLHFHNNNNTYYHIDDDNYYYQLLNIIVILNQHQRT